jgi:hypothetical protein
MIEEMIAYIGTILPFPETMLAIGIFGMIIGGGTIIIEGFFKVLTFCIYALGYFIDYLIKRQIARLNTKKTRLEKESN